MATTAEALPPRSPGRVGRGARAGDPNADWGRRGAQVAHARRLATVFDDRQIRDLGADVQYTMVSRARRQATSVGCGTA